MLFLFSIVAPVSGVQAAISLEGTVSATTGSGSAQTITLPSWTPDSDDLVLVSVAVRKVTTKVTVSGNGLTFVKIADVDNVQNQSSIQLFRAMSAAPSSGSITIRFFDLQDAPYSEFAAASASRFKGTDSIGTDGSMAVEATATDRGPVADNADMKVAITTVTDHAWLFAAGTYRTKTLNALPAGQTVIVKDLFGGDSGNKTSLATWRNEDVHPVSTVTMGANGSVSAATDWAIVAVSIKPGTGSGDGNSLSASPASPSLFVGSSLTVTVSGGTPGYTASSANTGIATVSVSDKNIIVTGTGVGSTTLTVSDTLGHSIALPVTVAPTLAANPASLTMSPGDSKSFTISGGAPGYTSSSGNTAVATITVSGTTVTVGAVATGTTAINIVDSVGSPIQVPVYVGTMADPGLTDCPVPPFATAGVGPNVLMILDNSGSMGSGAGSKWENAKAALKNIISANRNIRFGLMRLDRLNNHRSGKLLAPCGFKGTFASSADYIVNMIDTHMVGGPNPSSQTNLAQTLASAGQYFATVQLPDGTRRGMRVGDSATGTGPLDFGYYKRDNNYTYVINGVTYDAATTDDWGNTIDTTSPIKYSCEKSFVIFLTDGMSYRDDGWDVVTNVIGDYDGDGEEARDCWGWGGGYGPAPNPTLGEKCDEDPSVKGSTYMDDVAKFLYESDLRSDIAGKQNIITYTVAFSMGSDDTTLLRHAAEKGGGMFFSASNSVAELTAVFQAQIADINAKISSGTAVATITTSSSADDYFIRAKFFPGASFWKGYLESFVLPYDEGETPYWAAHDLLKDRVNTSGFADRKIYTYLETQNPKKQIFTAADGVVKTTLAALWAQTNTETADIINFIRGDKTYDGTKYRDREGWCLGDIVYSSPVAVGPPRLYYYGSLLPEYSTYQSFKSNHASRDRMVYVGVNDGMLHAFNASNGYEAWAYIPRYIQADLINLTASGCHKYYVDLTPVVADVFIGGKNESAETFWRTILIGGNRFGGSEYFALDVTDPSADGFSPLWDTIPFPGKSFKSSTLPQMGKVKAGLESDSDYVQDWVAIITSGYHEGTNPGEIVALKLADGTRTAIWDNGGSRTTSLTTQAKTGTHSYYTMTSPIAIDTDMDGYRDLILAGDSEGTLWKFYYDYHAKVWKKFALFNTGSNQAITSEPSIIFDLDGNLRIYFGTGKYLTDGDKYDATRSAFYCLVEKPAATNDANNGHFTRTQAHAVANLADLTGQITQQQFNALGQTVQDNALNNGWFFQLDASQGGLAAERVLARPMTVSGTVFFTTFKPNDDVCGYGGDSRLYAVDYLNSTVAMVNDEKVLEEGKPGTRYMDLGIGIASQPVYYFDRETKQTRLFIQKSDSTISDPVARVKERPMIINNWREK